MHTRSAIVAGLVAFSGFAACSKPDSTGGVSELAAATASSQNASRGDGQDQSRLQPPPSNALQPVDFPALHNVVTYAPGLYSGSAPAPGSVAFVSLVGLGVTTVISFDAAEPDVQAAAAHALRHVLLPIGYNGMDREPRLELAPAVKELPGPIYLHCHHGKQRSAGALGAAAVTLGMMTPQEATERMQVSGTSPEYRGLYQCVALATIATTAELSAADGSFPPVWKTSDLVQAMVEIDEASESLRLIQKAVGVMRDRASA